MTFEDLDLTCWTVPHRGWGTVTSLMVLPEDREVVAVRQSGRHAGTFGFRAAEPDSDQPHTEVRLPFDVADELERLVRSLRIEVPGTPARTFFGMTHYGVRLDVDHLTLTATWAGDLADAPPAVRVLHEWLEGKVTAALESDSGGRVH